MKRSDQIDLVDFVKLEDFVRGAGDIARSELKIMLGRARVTQKRAIRRFDELPASRPADPEPRKRVSAEFWSSIRCRKSKSSMTSYPERITHERASNNASRFRSIDDTLPDRGRCQQSLFAKSLRRMRFRSTLYENVFRPLYNTMNDL